MTEKRQRDRNLACLIHSPVGCNSRSFICVSDGEAETQALGSASAAFQEDQQDCKQSSHDSYHEGQVQVPAAPFLKQILIPENVAENGPNT